MYHDTRFQLYIGILIFYCKITWYTVYTVFTFKCVIPSKIWEKFFLKQSSNLKPCSVLWASSIIRTSVATQHLSSCKQPPPRTGVFFKMAALPAVSGFLTFFLHWASLVGIKQVKIIFGRHRQLAFGRCRSLRPGLRWTAAAWSQLSPALV